MLSTIYQVDTIWIITERECIRLGPKVNYLLNCDHKPYIFAQHIQLQEMELELEDEIKQRNASGEHRTQDATRSSENQVRFAMKGRDMWCDQAKSV